MTLTPNLGPGLRHALTIVQRLAQRTDGNASQHADGWRLALDEVCFHIGQDIERINQGDKA